MPTKNQLMEKVFILKYILDEYADNTNEKTALWAKIVSLNTDIKALINVLDPKRVNSTNPSACEETKRLAAENIPFHLSYFALKNIGSSKKNFKMPLHDGGCMSIDAADFIGVVQDLEMRLKDTFYRFQIAEKEAKLDARLSQIESLLKQLLEQKQSLSSNPTMFKP